MSRRNYNENKSRRTRNNWLSVLGIIFAAVMLSTLAVSAFGFATDGFTKSVLEKERNPDNLLTLDTYINGWEEFDETAKGLKIHWKDDGSFALSGKHEDTDQADSYIYTWEFAHVTLPAGTYTVSTGNTRCTEDTFGLAVSYPGVECAYVTDKEYTVTLTEESTVTVSLFVKNNERFFKLLSVIQPTISAGEQAVDFYE